MGKFKRTKISIVLFLSLLFLSCSIKREIPYDEVRQYKNKDESKNFYIVDTIQIKDPVIIDINGNLFIMSERSFKEYKGDGTDLYKRTDAYPWLDFFSIRDYEKSQGELVSTCLDFLTSESTQTKDYVFYSFDRQPSFFVLALIRIDFYIQSSSYDFSIPSNYDKEKYLYCKFVIPYCK